MCAAVAMIGAVTAGCAGASDAPTRPAGDASASVGASSGSGPVSPPGPAGPQPTTGERATTHASATATVAAGASSQEPTERPPRRARPTNTAPQSPNEGCPATHAEALKLRTDCAHAPYQCVYPDGRCGCESERHCGGAVMPPTPAMWVCDPPPREPCPPYP
ncbi:MAG: hypothetical protein U0414_25155 [Polyangiaceae bacterium]